MSYLALEELSRCLSASKVPPQVVECAQDVFDDLVARLPRRSPPTHVTGYIGSLFGIRVYVDPGIPAGHWRWVEQAEHDKRIKFAAGPQSGAET